MPATRVGSRESRRATTSSGSPRNLLDLKSALSRSIGRMKTILILATTLGWLATAAFSENRQSPFACDRGALNAQERQRHFDQLGSHLRTFVKSVREATDGYEFDF